MGTYPPLVHYSTELEYQAHYEQTYCKGPVMTGDGIAVRFRKANFRHLFFESTQRNGVKDAFSQPRACRIDWILAALNDPTIPMRMGWIKKKNRYDPARRVVVAQGNYVVVIHLTGNSKANHVTAYVADRGTVAKIMRGPEWTQKNR